MFMLAERRRDVRHKIQRPAYASIAEGSRGLILDANERGIALQSDSPVPRCARVSVRLDLTESINCIVTGGRVAWSDAQGRVGIEFLGISTECLGQLQHWLKSQSPAENGVAETAQRQATSAESSVDDLLASAIERAILLTRAHGAAIALHDRSGFVCRAVAGEITPLAGSQVDAQSGLTGACLRSGRLIRCNNADSDPLVDRESCRSLGISSIIAAPIVNASRVIGLIEVFSRRSEAFDTSDCFAIERLAGALADSAMRASLDHSRELCSETAETPDVAFRAAEAEPTPVDPAPPLLSRETLAILAADESSQLAILRLPASYELSLIEKLTLHKRVLLWSVAAIVLAFGLWLSFRNQWRWRSHPTPAENLQFSGRAQTSLAPSTRRGSRTSIISMTRDQLEEVRQQAERGDANAQLELGAAYASGKDDVQNYPEAVKWLTRSAEQGNATAATSLGAFYWAGRGVTQDYVQAYMWSAIAQAEGDEASSYRVTILKSRMSPVELTEARHRTAAWLRTHSKRNVVGN